jgi:outer membrane lipoprotein-sorting protein
MILCALTLTVSFGDGDAKQIFNRFERDLKACQSLSGDLVGNGSGFGPFKSTFLLQKPKSFRVIDGQINIYCNGKVQYNHLVREKEWFKRDVSKAFGFGAPYGLDAFFGLPTGSTAPYFEKKTEFRMQKVGERMCAAKAIHFESFDRDDRMVFFVDAKTKQLIGWDQVFGDTKMHYRFANMQLNPQVPKGAFDWKPLPGLKERAITRSGHP